VSEQINEKMDAAANKRFHDGVHAELKKVMDNKYYREFRASNDGRALDNVINHFGKSRGFRVDKTVKSIIDKYGRNRDEYVKKSFEMAAKARRGMREEYAVIVSMKDDSIEKELEKKFRKDFLGSGGSVDGGRDISFTVDTHDDAKKIEKFVKQRKYKKIVTDVDIFKEGAEMDEAKSVPLVRTGQGSYTKDTHPSPTERLYQAKDKKEYEKLMRDAEDAMRKGMLAKFGLVGNYKKFTVNMKFKDEKSRKKFEKMYNMKEEAMNSYVDYLSKDTTMHPNKSARLSIDARKEDV
tara:strand:+ start:194 stop:1075 length:882 start_codon:yes stop_codon:yes gene_type:complete